MSNPSVKYDPTTTAPEFVQSGVDIDEVILRLYDNKIPITLQTVAPNQSHFRDGLIAKALIQSTEFGINNLLSTLIQKIKSMPENESKELMTYCEMTASIAYSSGQLQLAKETLLRVNPEKVTRLLNTIYKAIQQGVPAEGFKEMVVTSGTSSIQLWDSIKNNI